MNKPEKKIKVVCPSGHEFDVEVDLRNYYGMTPEARHYGLRCATCDARVSLSVSAIRTTAEGETAPGEAVEADAERAAVNQPHPDYIQKNEEATPDPPKKRGPYTEEEIAARRAAGGGSGGL